MLFFFLGETGEKRVSSWGFFGIHGVCTEKREAGTKFGNFVAIATKVVRKNIQGKISLTFCLYTQKSDRSVLVH